jgi:hypothetical protein
MADEFSYLSGKRGKFTDYSLLEAASESHIKKTQGRILTVINLTEKSLVLISVKKY